MEFDEIYQVGLSREETFRVEAENSAAYVGSGSANVLATPWMIAFMERLAHRLLAERLPAGRSSVGVLVEVRHMAATPVGANVRVRAEITNVEGSRVTFAVSAWDDQEQIGAGTHERVIIDEVRFLKRVEAKQ